MDVNHPARIAHERVRARAEELKQHLIGCASCTTCDAALLGWALLAVVDRHKPDERGLCVLCGFDGQNLDCTYPCDELRVIAEEILADV